MPLESQHSLPDVDVKFIEADALLDQLESAQAQSCIDSRGKPLLTILDFRDENFLHSDNPLPHIKTVCRTRMLQMDDIREPAVRSSLPGEGLVVVVTETGNRDEYIMRYLSQFGFTNIKGLRFGMRSWIKSDFPISIGQPQK